MNRNLLFALTTVALLACTIFASSATAKGGNSQFQPLLSGVPLQVMVLGSEITAGIPEEIEQYDYPASMPANNQPKGQVSNQDQDAQKAKQLLAQADAMYNQATALRNAAKGMAQGLAPGTPVYPALSAQVRSFNINANALTDAADKLKFQGVKLNGTFKSLEAARQGQYAAANSQRTIANNPTYTPAVKQSMLVAADRIELAADKMVGMKPKSVNRGNAVNITFSNPNRLPVDVFWVDDQSKEIKYATIQPGKTWGTQTSDGHLWRFDELARTVGYYRANRLPNQTYAIKETIDNSNVSGPMANFQLMTYNTYLFNKVAENLPERSKAIANSSFVKNRDVIIFNELFENDSAANVLNGLKSQYPYQTGIVGLSTNGWDATEGSFSNAITVIRGGVSIVSKWPIERKEQYIFQAGCGLDGLANKGVCYIRINRNGKKIHIFGTHVQAADEGYEFGTGDKQFAIKNTCSAPKTGYDAGWRERQLQFKELRQFIDSRGIPRDEYVFIGGDLNVYKSKREYRDMIDALQVHNVNQFTGHGSTYDPLKNSLAHEGTGSSRLDYVFVPKGYASVSQWNNHVLTPKLSSTIGGKSDYSDHYPVVGSMKLLGNRATENVIYNVQLTTGTKAGTFGEETAGTDSNVKFRLIGAAGKKSDWINCETAANDFVANSTGSYEVSTPNLGNVSGIEINKDNWGVGPDWYLQSVGVQRGSKNYSWSGGKWFNAETATLPLDDRAVVRYSIRLSTGSKSGTFGEQTAGTDSNVKVRLYGSRGNSNWLNCDNAGNDFEANSTGTYVLSTKDLGTINKVEINKDNWGAGPGWFLTTVQVVYPGKSVSGRYNNWVASETINVSVR